MSANVFRFPAMGAAAAAAVKAAAAAPPVPALETFDPDRAKALHSILENALEKSRVLMGFIHEDRELAQLAGVEGIGIELQGLAESDRLLRVQDALAEAVRLGEGVSLTHEGLGRLHRLEELVSEGIRTLGRHREGGKVLSGRRLGQSSSVDVVGLGAVMLLGAVAITLVLALVSRKSGDGEHRPMFSSGPE